MNSYFSAEAPPTCGLWGAAIQQQTGLKQWINWATVPRLTVKSQHEPHFVLKSIMLTIFIFWILLEQLCVGVQYFTINFIYDLLGIDAAL